MFLPSLVAPFAFAGIIAILLSRFGPAGLIIVGVIFLIIPLQTLVGKLNSATIQNANIYKDSRVKVCTEIIQGIKFIKLYGW